MLWRSCSLGAFLLLAGCSPEAKTADMVESKTVDADASLATVAGKAITVLQLDSYEQALPDHLRSKNEGPKGHRAHLQSLVDKELVLIEARKRGLDKLPALKQALSELVNKRLAEQVSHEMVSANFAVDDEELLAAYEEHKLGWEVWPAHILSASEEDARKIIAELNAGASFSELAREYSLASDAEKGGNLGGYFDQSSAVGPLRDGSFHLDEGQISEPIRTIDGYEVIKILKKRRASFEQMRPSIAEQVGQRKAARLYETIVDSLKGVYGIRYHRDRVHNVLDGMKGRRLEEAQARAALVEYTGGEIKVSDAMLKLRDEKNNTIPPDSAAAFWALELKVIPDSMMVVEARSRGWHQRADILEWKEIKRDGLIAGQLRMDEVRTASKISTGEIRAYYDKYLDTYRSLPGIIQMTEVLCNTREEAERLLAQAQSGEPLEELAVRHSVRSSMEPVGGHTFADSGHVTVGSLVQSPYRTHFGDSNNKDVGVLQGPLEVQGKYSVFRLDEPFEMALMAFQRVRQQIYTDIRQRREGELFNGFLDSLRQAYVGQVQIGEEMLARYAAER